MKRVCLGISMLAFSLVGGPWPGNPALSRADEACPAMDMEYGEHADCPYLEEMRAYGECHWYYDNCRHGALPDAATGEADEPITWASEATTEAEVEATIGAEVEATTEAEIEATTEVEIEAMVETPVRATVEAAVEMTLEATVEADVEATAAANSAASSDAGSIADCWYDCETDEYYHYEFSQVPSEIVTDASSGQASAWDEGDCLDEFYQEVMESPREETEIAQPAGEYRYEDGGCPYGYEYDKNYGFSDSVPVQAWEDADVEAVEGEDDDEPVPPAPTSDLVQFDSEVILSLARTLDRMGSTLQSLSHYLTEMATADMALRRDAAIRR